LKGPILTPKSQQKDMFLPRFRSYTKRSRLINFIYQRGYTMWWSIICLPLSDGRKYRGISMYDGREFFATAFICCIHFYRKRAGWLLPARK